MENLFKLSIFLILGLSTIARGQATKAVAQSNNAKSYWDENNYFPAMFKPIGKRGTAVTFVQSARSFYIDKNLPRYKRILALLEKAETDTVLVNVRLRANGKEIIDAKFADKEMNEGFKNSFKTP